MSTDPILERILEKVRELRNFDLRNYKRATLARRVDRRVTERRLKGREEYLDRLEKDPTEVDALVSSLLIKVTGFFRDEEIWKELGDKIVPELLQKRRPREELRIWSAGCATGEEAYSLTMLLAENMGSAFSSADVKVFGTDVDEASIAFARRAIYSTQQVKDVSPERLRRFFVPCPEGHTVRQEIRRAVVFGVNNLISDAPISHLDLILCRNVFIYMNADLQRRVLSRFHYALRRNGVLVLGRAELIPFASKIYEPVDLGHRVYRKDHRTDVPAAQERMVGLLEQDALAGRIERAEVDADVTLDRDVLDALRAPVVVIANDGTILRWNSAAAHVWSRGANEVVGRRLAAVGISGLAADAILDRSLRVREGKSEREEMEILVTQTSGATPYFVDITSLRSGRQRIGLVYTLREATTHRSMVEANRRVSDEIEAANQKLKGSIEELRAANEELETTNEELQSANEELQTTNEELQSTNEELETTNEELQSANEELDEINRELAHRTEQMNLLALYQRTIIRSLGSAVVVLDTHGRVTSWNLAAERLLGLPEAEALSQTLWTLRVPALSRALVQRIRRTIAEKRAFRVEDAEYELPTGGTGYASIAAIPLVEDDENLGTVLLFEDSTRALKLAAELKRVKGERRITAGRSTRKP